MENEIKEQVSVLGVKYYDDFTDRQGNEVKGGCAIEYGIAYDPNSEFKKGLEVRKFTFRNDKELIFSKFKNIKIPCVGLLTAHRENALSSNLIVDSIEPIV